MARSQDREDPVPCTVEDCSMAFSGKSEMDRHVDEYHGDAKRCTICPFATKRRSRLRKHKEKVHSYKMELELPDDSFSHAGSATNGQMTPQPQAQEAQQTTTGYNYSEPSAGYRYPHGEFNVPIHSLESNPSSVSNGFFMPSAMNSTSQTNSAEFGMSPDFHPPMTFPPTYNDAAMHGSIIWNTNATGDEQSAGADADLQEEHVGTGGNEEVNGNPSYT